MANQPMRTPCRAVALGGGGSKGSYEVGVWQAMRELNLRYHVVTGTSVGALNGALMSIGLFDQALEMWSTMDNTRVMTDIPALSSEENSLQEVYRAFANQMLHSGGVDISPLEATLRGLLDEDAIRRSPVELGIVTVEYPTLRPVQWFVGQIPKGRLADYLLASAACFPAFKPREIDGKTFIDGGYHDLMPVELALRATAPVSEVIAVDIEGIGILRPLPNHLPVTVLRCYWDLGNMLIFDGDRCRRNIRLGYLDGMKMLGSYGGMAYAFAPGQVEALEEAHLEALSRIFLRTMEALSRKDKLEVDAIVAGRILTAATRRRVSTPQQLNLRELHLCCAELAAELLGLEPTELYTAETFDRQLRQRYAALAARAVEVLAAFGDKKKLNLRQLIGSLQGEMLLAAATQIIRQLVAGIPTGVSIQLLASLLPREFLAALYLEALR